MWAAKDLELAKYSNPRLRGSFECGFLDGISYPFVLSFPCGCWRPSDNVFLYFSCTFHDPKIILEPPIFLVIALNTSLL